MLIAAETPISVQISWAVIAAYGIQFVKKLQTIPKINYETENLNRLFSIFVAAAIGAGITFTFNRVDSTFAIGGLTPAHVFHFFSFAIQQFAMQHGVYKTMIAPPLAGKVQDLARLGNKVEIKVEPPKVGG